MKFILISLSLLISTSLFAQPFKPVSVKASQNIMDLLSAADIYYFPAFANGTVFFRDGTKGSAKLNYDLFMDEMRFIDTKGDTLALANDVTEQIDYISVAQELFYSDKGYVRHLAISGDLKLAIREVWTKVDLKKSGIYNSQGLSESTVPMASYFVYGKNHDLLSNRDMELVIASNYYIGDKSNQFVLASKKNLIKLLPKEEAKIQAYLKNNKIDFSKKDDLIKLIVELSP